MRDSDSVRVAAIQAAPVFLDTEASLEKAIEHVRTAAGKGATLAAFGEGWLPGYPIHCWSANEPELWWELAGEYLDQAIEVPGPETEALCSAAREVASLEEDLRIPFHPNGEAQEARIVFALLDGTDAVRVSIDPYLGLARIADEEALP